MAKRILQFGTSRFLQAHVDLFVHEAREAGQDIGPITVVKTTVGGPRESRVDALRSPDGFPVRVRGYKAGQLVDETAVVKSVSRALDANRQWLEVVRIFVDETEIVVSNVGDNGYQVSHEEGSRPGSGTVPLSYPAKLLALLIERFENGGRALLILPCELVNDNGAVLRNTLTELSGSWAVSEAFKEWLRSSVTICNTLVDRIVSEAIEPIGAVTEPYAVWVIQRTPSFDPPFQHPKIIYTYNLEPYLRLKLHILNLGHTVLAEIWQKEGRPSAETVREILLDTSVKQRLMSLYADEVVTGFAAYGMGESARQYVITTMERLQNPFLNHRLSDIAQNHTVKIERRVTDFVRWVHEKDRSQQLPLLTELSQHSRARPTGAGETGVQAGPQT